MVVVYMVVFLLLEINSVLTGSLVTSGSLSEDGSLNFTQLSFKYGHTAEEHSVVTEDGYILTLFHIPGKRKLPVLLLHGMIDSADTFIIRGNRSLAIALANKGYDVWAGNNRGNKYARRYTSLDPDTDPSFWDFSFHERGYYDLTAMNDYILNMTGEKKLQSIGHSEGTTNHFVLGSLRPEHNEKFKIFIALAPAVFLSNLIKPVSTVVELAPLANQILLATKKEKIFGEGGVEKNLKQWICNYGLYGDVSKYLCVYGLIFQFAGYDPKRFEAEFLNTVIGHYPESDSRKSFLHFAQVAIEKRFAHFDHGQEDNLKRYGSILSPEYNLTQVYMKTALVVGRNDYLSRVRDVEYLKLILPNIVNYHVMEPKRWNHLDFVWGNDLPKTLVPHIISLLQKYA